MGYNPTVDGSRYLSGATLNYFAMPWVAAVLPLVVLQHVISSDPQLAQVWVAASLACLPRPTLTVVVLQAAQRCETTALVGKPCDVSRLPPFAALSGAVMNTSWHFAQDMGLESLEVAAAMVEPPLRWSISCPPLT